MNQKGSPLRVGDLVWVENDGQWTAGLVVQVELSFVSVQVADHEVSLPSNEVFPVCPEEGNPVNLSKLSPKYMNEASLVGLFFDRIRAMSIVTPSSSQSTPKDIVSSLRYWCGDNCVLMAYDSKLHGSIDVSDVLRMEHNDDEGIDEGGKHLFWENVQAERNVLERLKTLLTPHDRLPSVHTLCTRMLYHVFSERHSSRCDWRIIDRTEEDDKFAATCYIWGDSVHGATEGLVQLAKRMCSICVSEIPLDEPTSYPFRNESSETKARAKLFWKFDKVVRDSIERDPEQNILSSQVIRVVENATKVFKCLLGDGTAPLPPVLMRCIFQFSMDEGDLTNIILDTRIIDTDLPVGADRLKELIHTHPQDNDDAGSKRVHKDVQYRFRKDVSEMIHAFGIGDEEEYFLVRCLRVCELWGGIRVNEDFSSTIVRGLSILTDTVGSIQEKSIWMEKYEPIMNVLGLGRDVTPENIAMRLCHANKSAVAVQCWRLTIKLFHIVVACITQRANEFLEFLFHRCSEEAFVRRSTPHLDFKHSFHVTLLSVPFDQVTMPDIDGLSAQVCCDFLLQAFLGSYVIPMEKEWGLQNVPFQSYVHDNYMFSRRVTQTLFGVDVEDHQVAKEKGKETSIFGTLNHSATKDAMRLFRNAVRKHVHENHEDSVCKLSLVPRFVDASASATSLLVSHTFEDVSYPLSSIFMQTCGVFDMSLAMDFIHVPESFSSCFPAIRKTLEESPITRIQQNYLPFIRLSQAKTSFALFLVDTQTRNVNASRALPLVVVPWLLSLRCDLGESMPNDIFQRDFSHLSLCQKFEDGFITGKDRTFMRRSFKKKLMQEKSNEDHHAASVIQHMIRASLFKNHVQYLLLQIRLAAMRIQRVYRQHYRKRIEAAKIIQRAYQEYVDTRIMECVQEMWVEAAIVIQRAYRSYKRWPPREERCIMEEGVKDVSLVPKDEGDAEGMVDMDEANDEETSSRKSDVQEMAGKSGLESHEEELDQSDDDEESHKCTGIDHNEEAIHEDEEDCCEKNSRIVEEEHVAPYSGSMDDDTLRKAFATSLKIETTKEDEVRKKQNGESVGKKTTSRPRKHRKKLSSSKGADVNMVEIERTFYRLIQSAQKAAGKRVSLLKGEIPPHPGKTATPKLKEEGTDIKPKRIKKTKKGVHKSKTSVQKGEEGPKVEDRLIKFGKKSASKLTQRRKEKEEEEKHLVMKSKKSSQKEFQRMLRRQEKFLKEKNAHIQSTLKEREEIRRETHSFRPKIDSHSRALVAGLRRDVWERVSTTPMQKGDGMMERSDRSGEEKFQSSGHDDSSGGISGDADADGVHESFVNAHTEKIASRSPWGRVAVFDRLYDLDRFRRQSEDLDFSKQQDMEFAPEIHTRRKKREKMAHKSHFDSHISALVSLFPEAFARRLHSGQDRTPSIGSALKSRRGGTPLPTFTPELCKRSLRILERSDMRAWREWQDDEYDEEPGQCR